MHTIHTSYNTGEALPPVMHAEGITASPATSRPVRPRPTSLLASSPAVITGGSMPSFPVLVASRASQVQPSGPAVNHPKTVGITNLRRSPLEARRRRGLNANVRQHVALAAIICTNHHRAFHFPPRAAMQFTCTSFCLTPAGVPSSTSAVSFPPLTHPLSSPKV
jgi:hypothetical protein